MTNDTAISALHIATIKDSRSCMPRVGCVIQGVQRPAIKPQRATGLCLLDQQGTQALLVNPGSFNPLIDAGELSLHRRAQRNFHCRAGVATRGNRINNLKGGIPAWREILVKYLTELDMRFNVSFHKPKNFNASSFFSKSKWEISNFFV